MTPRLLLLNNQGLAAVGGGPSIMRHLVRHLAGRYRVTVASHDDPAPGWDVAQVRLGAPPAAGRLWRVAPLHKAWSLRLPGRLPGRLPVGLLEDADLVVVLDVHAGLAVRAARRLVYVSLSCVPLQERAMGAGLPLMLQYAWLERILAQRAGAVVVSSRAHAADLRRWTGLPGLSPVVLHPVLPGEAVDEPPGGVMMILAAGRLVVGKRFDAVVDLARRLQDLPVRWVIAGDGPERGALEAAAAGLPVRFAGAVPDLTGLLAEASVLVHPSPYESFGMTVFEAVRAGRPVLCGPGAGVREVLPNAFVVQAGAMEAGMRRLVTDPAHRAAMERLARQAGRRALATNYAEGFEAVVRGVLAG